MATKVTVTLQDLAEAYIQRDHRAYKRLLENVRVSERFKSMLTSKHETWRFAKNLEYQEEEIELLRKMMWQYEEDIKLCEQKCEDAYKNMQVAKKTLEAAEKTFRKAREEWESQKKQKSDVEGEKRGHEILLEQQVKKLEQMKKFTLVHPTATLSALDKKKDTVIVCTKFDADNMHFAKFADYILDTTEDDLGEEDIPQDARNRFSSIQEFYSAIQYVKMVVRYWAENKPYELLYNSEGIKYILESIF